MTGVSGSGKSTLIQDILYPALLRHFGQATESPGEHDDLLGADWLSSVNFVDQSPIGKTARSNLPVMSGLSMPCALVCGDPTGA